MASTFRSISYVRRRSPISLSGRVVAEPIREALHPYPEGLKLVTKVGARRDDTGAWLPALSPAALRSGVEDNLRTLQVERMDLVNLRLDDEHVAEGRLAEQLRTLQDVRQEGKLDLIGISNADTETVRRALDRTDIASVQNAYSIVNRAGEDELALCEERGLAFVPFFPLGSAFTGGPKQLAAAPAIGEVATKHRVSPSQVALAWLMHHSERILIPGTGSVEHLEETIAAGDIELDEQDMRRLDGATQLPKLAAPAEH